MKSRTSVPPCRRRESPTIEHAVRMRMIEIDEAGRLSVAK